MSNFHKFFNKKYLKIILLLICGVMGVILLIGGEGSWLGEEKRVDEQKSQLPSVDEYEKQIEEKVIRICSSVKGVGNVSCAVSLGSGYTAIYAQDSQSSGGGYRNEIVLVGGGAKSEPLLIGYNPPQILGIGIICDGGGDEYTKCEITSLVCATFGISPAKIYVAEAKK